MGLRRIGRELCSLLPSSISLDSEHGRPSSCSPMGRFVFFSYLALTTKAGSPRKLANGVNRMAFFTRGKDASQRQLDPTLRNNWLIGRLQRFHLSEHILPPSPLRGLSPRARRTRRYPGDETWLIYADGADKELENHGTENRGTQ